MRSCEWHRTRRSLQINSKIYCFLGKNSISEGDLIAAIRDGTFFGLAKVDVESPPEMIAKYEALNFPFIFG